MIDIDVKIIYQGYEIHYSEQEYHDARIKLFKSTFERELSNWGSRITTRFYIHCEYYPKTQKFKIIDYNPQWRASLSRTVEMAKEFTKEYLVNSL